MNGLAGRIDALLPQTQCTKCGYPSCRRYADAIATGEADINQCPPGGDAAIRGLAGLLGREVRPLNPRNGIEQPRRVAVIDEARCIGCTLCIQACPVDAIVGAAKLMHTVVTELCSGCDLCVAPCPVDCIEMLPAKEEDVWDAARALDDASHNNWDIAGSAVEFAAAVAATLAPAAAQRCTQDCIQVHGGIGYTWEHDAHLYLKRLLSWSAFLGGSDRYLQEVGRQLATPMSR